MAPIPRKDNLHLREIVDYNLTTTATGGQDASIAISNRYKRHGSLALRSKAGEQSNFRTGSASKVVKVKRGEYPALLSSGGGRNRMVRSVTVSVD
jgi:hypothetical protein